jgi:pyridinium-3,5-bisthiocarboxylic acid mononucleotide nickel chelatase
VKVLIFDPFSGCAGDMILGALVSAGVDFDHLKSELEKLNLPNYELEKTVVNRHHIECVKVNVLIGEEHTHRHLKHIYEIIDSSALSDIVKTNSKKIFGRLAETEADIHGTTPDKVHFHEVGAVDAIVDIVGSCIALELLGADKIYTRLIGLGSGVIKAAHGTIPVPSPATSGLVEGFPVVFRSVENELTTPTGAAIITSLAKPLNNLESFRINKIGYGAGSKEIEKIANFLRVYVADKVMDLEHDRILQIETNIDNMNPEIFSYLHDGLFELGVKDFITIPVHMKKNRPGTLLKVLCKPEDKDTISDFIFANSTTSGMRYSLLERVMLKRSNEMVETSYGRINVKIYYIDGKRRLYPEYEDLKKLALEHKISIIELTKNLQIEINKIKEF